MNLSQYFTLKMGHKLIFKEPLQNLKIQRNSNYMNSNYQKNNYYSPNNYNINSRVNQKKNYQGMDVIPKFIANENMKEINRELLNRMQNKKATFTKILKTYFSEGDNNFFNSIKDIEMEMNNERLSLESLKNKDYDGFKDMISFINNNRTNAKLTSMQNKSSDEYKVLNNEEKNQILGGINQNKPLFYQKLNLKNVKINNNNNLDNNPYIISNQRQRAKTTNTHNISDKNKNSGNKQKNLVTQDQIELFKILIGNRNISNNEVLTYFNSNNSTVKVAAERYFQQLYGTENITLQYFFPYQQNVGIKIHKFRFIAEISDLIMAAHNDYLSLNTPRLYLENGREIKMDKKIKCIGALGLQNNSKIKIII